MCQSLHAYIKHMRVQAARRLFIHVHVVALVLYAVISVILQETVAIVLSDYVVFLRQSKSVLQQGSAA